MSQGQLETLVKDKDKKKDKEDKDAEENWPDLDDFMAFWGSVGIPTFTVI
jgi:hypothetical protein